MAKRGNASHFYQLGAFEFLIGRAVSVTKRQQSHATSARGNCNITIARWIQPRIVSHSVQIRTLYLGLYKCARHSSEEKKNIKETIKTSSDTIINVQLNELARHMRILYFKSVFMCNRLPTTENVHPGGRICGRRIGRSVYMICKGQESS